MAEFDPKMDEAFREYADWRLRRHYLLLDGKEDSVETDEAEVRMEELWEGFDDIQRRSLSGMGSDLNWIRRNFEPPQGTKNPGRSFGVGTTGIGRGDEIEKMASNLALFATLHPAFVSSSLASERRTAYEAIGLPKYASLFAQAIGYGPINRVAKVPRNHAGFDILQATTRQRERTLIETTPASLQSRPVVATNRVSKGSLVPV